MTRYLGQGGVIYLLWDDESDPVDWTTPNTGDGIDDEYCGNCGLDSPGCGCPRDPDYRGSHPATLPIQLRSDAPIPIGARKYNP